MKQEERHKLIATIRGIMGFPWSYLHELNDVELAQLYCTAESYGKYREETV